MEQKQETKLTNSEYAILSIAIRCIIDAKGVSNGIRFEEIYAKARKIGFSDNQTADLIAKLKQKGMLEEFDDFQSEAEGRVTDLGMKMIYNQVYVDLGSGKDKTSISVVKVTAERKARVDRKVGERHPNGLWLWTEYKPGVFDWRMDPALKKQVGRRSGQVTSKPETEKAESKDEKEEHKATLAILLKLPNPKKLNQAQTAVLKDLRRGMRLKKERGKLYLVSGDERKEVDKAVLESLQRKYKITHVPDDVWFK